MTQIPIRRALLSVYDKSGIDELARGLHDAGVQLVSTGGTASRIASLGIPVQLVEELTGFPECLDGRVKTLHPVVHAGILADQGNPEHVKQLSDLGISSFELVVSNLYPFAETVAAGKSDAEVIEQIDIGGPSMVRAAAKNHGSIAVVTSPERYSAVLDAVRDGGFTLQARRSLAAEAFAHTAAYDAGVANWFAAHEAWVEATKTDSPQQLPAFLGVALERQEVLRYGENPHQQAARYLDPNSRGGLARADQLHGGALSYNNYVDADAAWRAVHDFGDPCVAVIKHANPCGIAVGLDIAQAHQKAHACDPVSAFGGVIAANRQVDAAMAEQVAQVRTDVIVAPSYSDGALEILRGKKNTRVLQCEGMSDRALEWRLISGGALAQTVDLLDAPGDSTIGWKLAAGEDADQETLRDLVFAWRAIRSVKSNAILLAREQATVGIGMGQVNRVDSSRLAVTRAGDRAQGSVAASDAFFPFADGLTVLLDAGVRAVVQPGGSVRDEEVITAAKAAGITLYLTGTRHFLH